MYQVTSGMPHVHRLSVCLKHGPIPDLSAPEPLVLLPKKLSVLLAPSPVELLSIQLRRLLDEGAEEGWHLAVVDCLEGYRKGY